MTFEEKCNFLAGTVAGVCISQGIADRQLNITFIPGGDVLVKEGDKKICMLDIESTLEQAKDMTVLDVLGGVYE